MSERENQIKHTLAKKSSPPASPIASILPGLFFNRASKASVKKESVNTWTKAGIAEELSLALFTLFGIGFLVLAVVLYANPNDIRGKIIGGVDNFVSGLSQGETNSRFVPVSEPRATKIHSEYVKSGLMIHERVDISRLVVLQTITSYSSVEEKIYPVTASMVENALWNVENGKPYSLLEKHTDLPPRIKTETEIQKERESIVAIQASLIKSFD